MEGLTPDLIEQILLEEEANIARSRARQIVALRAAMVMQLPTADGCKSMREWVAGRLDVAAETANQLTSTASRLDDSPELEAALACGTISFDRASATSRIPPERQTDDLMGLDVAGICRLAAHHKRMTRADDYKTHRSQHLTFQPNLDESRFEVWGHLDGYAGPVIAKRLTEEADLIDDTEQLGVGYRRALALLKLCEDGASGQTSTPTITVFVDDHGIEVEGGTAAGPAILDKLACAGTLELIKTKDGTPLAVGRRSRVISPRLRRFVMHRDGGCVADGCTSGYRLEAHHIVPWSEGGHTDPDNLVTLCWFHHHVVVHGMGLRIDISLGRGRVRFVGHDP